MQRDFRLVHLDLKGAPPRVSYYHEIFPLFKEWGVTGLLIEYEDMFPYKDDFKCLQAPYAYSQQDISDLLQLAQHHSLEVIPLVQSFGHLEFVLKHDRFRHLREVERYPMALCPCHPDSLDVVVAMISQMLSLHSEVKWLHVGADEVFHLGVCEKCQAKMAENNWTKVDLFLDYMCRLLRMCQKIFPHVTFIMWDDMLRRVKDTKVLENSGIGTLAELMVWHYLDTFDLEPDLFSRYSKVFPSLWAASAFKGATGPTQQTTDITYHLQNHRAWLDRITQEAGKFTCFRGYALTGWQRYDHYATLCELLPVGLPSLVACLACLKHGTFNLDIHKKVAEGLGFVDGMPLAPFLNFGTVPVCQFPGSEVYVGMHEYLQLDIQYFQFLRHESHLHAWMNDYQVRRNFVNPVHVEQFLPTVSRMLERFQQLSNRITSAMSAVFFPDVLEEWVEVNVQPKTRKLSEILAKGERMISVGAGVKGTGSSCSGDAGEQMDVNNL